METKPVILQPPKIPIVSNGVMGVQTNVAQAAMAAINYELMVAWHSMGSSEAKQRFFTEAYPVLKEGLGEYIDARALTNHKELHHVYEWGMVGDPAGRLWNIRKIKTGPDSFKIEYYFLVSKRTVPIDPILKTRGTSGAFVSKSTVFKNKAIVMESGEPVVITRKSSKFLTIPASNFESLNSGKGIIFTKGPIIVRSPGGRATKGSFSRNFSIWFRSGLATKYLKASGAYARVAERTTRSGRVIPARISKLGISGSISAAEIDGMAMAAVARTL